MSTFLTTKYTLKLTNLINMIYILDYVYSNNQKDISFIVSLIVTIFIAIQYITFVHFIYAYCTLF